MSGRISKLSPKFRGSCFNCKNSNLKCDHQKPLCSACVKNNVPAYLCSYSDSGYFRSIRDEINFSLIDGIGDMSNMPRSSLSVSSKSVPVNLENFTYFKNEKETRVFFGPTCWKTVLKFSLDKFPLILEIIDKSCNELQEMALRSFKDSPVDPPTGVEEGVKCLPDLLPVYTECLSIVDKFLQGEKDMFTSCFDATTIHEYFNSVFAKSDTSKYVVIKPGCSHVRLSVIISIIVIAAYNDKSIAVDKTSLTAISKLLVNAGDMKSTIPTLVALVALYESRKYDFNIDFEEAISHDQSLFANLVTFAVSSGLNRDIESIHGNGNVGYTESLRCIWKYVVFEDTWRSFQKGQQPLVREDYVDADCFRNKWERYCDRIRAFRAVNDMINSHSGSKSVNLEDAISKVSTFAPKELEFSMDMSREDMYISLISLIYMQALTYIRYLKQPSPLAKDEAYKCAIHLFLVAKQLTELFYTNNGTKSTMSYTPYFHEIKEALFRSVFVIVTAVFEGMDDYILEHQEEEEKVIFSAELVQSFFKEDFESRQLRYRDIICLLNIVTNEFQPVIGKLSTVSISSKMMFLFANNLLSYVMNEVETSSSNPTSVNSEKLDSALEDYSPYYDITSLNKDDIWEFFL